VFDLTHSHRRWPVLFLGNNNFFFVNFTVSFFSSYFLVSKKLLYSSSAVPATLSIGSYKSLKFPKKSESIKNYAYTDFKQTHFYSHELCNWLSYVGLFEGFEWRRPGNNREEETLVLILYISGSGQTYCSIVGFQRKQTSSGVVIPATPRVDIRHVTSST